MKRYFASFFVTGAVLGIGLGWGLSNSTPMIGEFEQDTIEQSEQLDEMRERIKRIGEKQEAILTRERQLNKNMSDSLGIYRKQ